MHTVFKDFVFHAAHLLPNVPDSHPCRRLHGHEYHVSVYVGGAIDPHIGWVNDYADIAVAWAPLHNQLDHHYLNEIAGLENSTSEHLAKWIWDRLRPSLPGLAKVVVRETCTAGCEYEGER